jgi:hypothetical protein
MALYDSTGTNLGYDTEAATDFSRIPLSSGIITLNPGVYYVMVESWTTRNGPFALSVRTDNIDLQGLPDLASNAGDTWESDDDPTPSNPTANTTVPTKPDPIKVGSALSRYSAANDWDWFTFVLP